MTFLQIFFFLSKENIHTCNIRFSGAFLINILPPSYPLWYTQPHARALYWVLLGQVMLCQFTPSTNCWNTERSPNIGRLSQGPWWKESPGQGSVQVASFSQPWYFLYLCPVGQQSPTDFCKLHFQYDRQFPESIGWETICLKLHLSEKIISKGWWYVCGIYVYQQRARLSF